MLVSNFVFKRLRWEGRFKIFHSIHIIWLFLCFQDHCCILYSIIGWNCSIGVWSRVEGSRCDPNPNEEFAKPDGESLFGNNGKLTPSITILGKKLAQTWVFQFSLWFSLMKSYLTAQTSLNNKALPNPLYGIILRVIIFSGRCCFFFKIWKTILCIMYWLPWLCKAWFPHKKRCWELKSRD